MPVDANGDALTFLPGLTADTYVVKVKIDANNGFWTANPVGLGTINVAIGTTIADNWWWLGTRCGERQR